ATADEEVGQGVGAGWFVEHHPELVRDAEFLVNEGGTIRLNEDRGVEYYGVGTTEKSPFWLQLVARGTAGHGSRPTPDNPAHRLIRGVARVAAFQTPLVVTPPVDRYFRDLATIEPDAQRRAWFQDIRAAVGRIHRQPLLPEPWDCLLRRLAVPGLRSRLARGARE